MKKSSINWTVKRLGNMIEKGQISFDYPIQRKGGQWDLLQKSLLIHSVASDYPLPSIYSIANKEILGEGDKAKETLVYYILDGKQRLTNITDFLKDEYRLHEDTPSVMIDGNKYDIAEMLFSEMHEEVQDAILSFSLQNYKLDEATDEEIEDLFFRLNNGTPLSKQQKAKAKMGTETAKRLVSIVEHKLMKENANFTKLQLRKADDELAVIQSMMLLDDEYELKSFSSNDVFNYSCALREGNEKVFERVENAMTYLNETLDNMLEKTLLKKLHFPMMILASDIALKNEIPQPIFNEWLDEFKKELNRRDNGELSENPMDYKLGMGAGSVKRDKVFTRVEAIKSRLNKLIERLKESDDANTLEKENASKEVVSEVAEDSVEEKPKGKTTKKPKVEVKPVDVDKKEEKNIEPKEENKEKAQLELIK